MKALAVTLLVAMTATAHADHPHMGMAMPDDHPFRASASLLAAQYDSMYYAGEYQGLGLGFAWSDARIALHASLPVYRLVENGATRNGLGDAMLGGHVMVSRFAIGVMASVPTGDSLDGLGMGHVMLMPSASTGVEGAHGAATIAIGFDRALSGMSHHDHGPWPLVDPMNMSEATGVLRGELGPERLRATARVSAAIAVGAPGATRAIAAVGARWTHADVETTAELAVGLAGDPFTLRGLVETAIHF